MKAKLRAKVLEVVKDSQALTRGTKYDGMTKLKIETINGKVDTTLNNAQFVVLNGDLFLKGVIADQMKIGATITINISDEEENE